MPISLEKLLSPTAATSFEFMGETVNVTFAPYRYTGEMQELAERLSDEETADAATIADLREQADTVDRGGEQGREGAGPRPGSRRSELRGKAEELAVKVDRRARKKLRDVLATNGDGAGGPAGLLVAWDVMEGRKPLKTDRETIDRLPDVFLRVLFLSLARENQPDPPKAPTPTSPEIWVRAWFGAIPDWYELHPPPRGRSASPRSSSTTAPRDSSASRVALVGAMYAVEPPQPSGSRGSRVSHPGRPVCTPSSGSPGLKPASCATSRASNQVNKTQGVMAGSARTRADREGRRPGRHGVLRIGEYAAVAALAAAGASAKVGTTFQADDRADPHAGRRDAGRGRQDAPRHPGDGPRGRHRRPTSWRRACTTSSRSELRGAEALDILHASALGAKVGLADMESVTNALTAVWFSGIKGAKSMTDAMAILDGIVGVGNMHLQDLTDSFGLGHPRHRGDVRRRPSARSARRSRPDRRRRAGAISPRPGSR
jgi:hypothetical protein